MQVEDFVDAIDEADFETLMQDNLENFLFWVKERLREGDDNVVIRCALEDDSLLLPFYVWLVYEVIEGDGFIGLATRSVYVPKDEELSSYYNEPKNLKGRSYYPVVIE